MQEELEYEFNEFLSDMKDNALTFGRYFVEDDYEDEYSHNDIYEYQDEFIEKVKEYLHNNRPGEFIVTGGWCVFVMTVEEARKHNINMIDDWLVK